MNKVLSIVHSEPVRVIVYPLLVALIGALVAKGTIDSSLGDIVTAIVAALVGIPAAEVARAKVTPVARLVASDGE
ncbi:hypothetical protein [Nocardia spumae]|uniref:hypothetical protein n=1 Tax=Nocardia spumae TaxID=2887190 RepID=UPI001D151202|nr:hypothetical protein [Nocardia spumae]